MPTASIGVDVKRRRICHVPSRVIRNNCDVIADLILLRITGLRVERIAHRDIRRPRDTTISTPGIE